MSDDYETIMRVQDTAAQAAIAKAMGFITTPEAVKEETPKEESPKELSDYEKTRRIVAEKEAEIDRLCAEIEEMRLPTGNLSGRRLALSVAKAHRVSFKDMIGGRRHKHLARARQHAMWVMREMTGLSFPQIGKILGGRDHTTVLHGVRAHQQRIDRGEI